MERWSQGMLRAGGILLFLTAVYDLAWGDMDDAFYTKMFFTSLGLSVGYIAVGGVRELLRK